MSPLDITFLSLAVIQVVAVGAMIAAAVLIKERVQDGAQQAAPAVRKAREIAATGQAMASRGQKDGATMARLVTGVVAKVRRRVATTTRLVKEVKQQLPAATASVEPVKEQGEAMVRGASEAKGLLRRLGRIGLAARAAVDASREGSGTERGS